VEKFPGSPWVTDARVMKFEIAAPLGQVYSSNVPPRCTAHFDCFARLTSLKESGYDYSEYNKF
jgi:hypothetical protein